MKNTLNGWLNILSIPMCICTFLWQRSTSISLGEHVFWFVVSTAIAVFCFCMTVINFTWKD
jgi:hypothetical protein